jgi:hypothetical protein
MLAHDCFLYEGQGFDRQDAGQLEARRDRIHVIGRPLAFARALCVIDEQSTSVDSQNQVDLSVSQIYVSYATRDVGLGRYVPLRQDVLTTAERTGLIGCGRILVQSSQEPRGHRTVREFEVDTSGEFTLDVTVSSRRMGLR